jgi:hypothetical protein
MVTHPFTLPLRDVDQKGIGEQEWKRDDMRELQIIEFYNDKTCLAYQFIKFSIPLSLCCGVSSNPTLERGVRGDF